MRILYVSQYFPPEMGAPAARVSELSRHWVRMGHDVAVLTGFPNHPTGVVPEEYRARLRSLLDREEWEGVRVERTWLWPLPNRKTIERILNYSSFCISAALRGSFLPRPQIVIGTSPQLLCALAAWWISRAHSVPFVLEVRDLWPESLEAVGVSGQGSKMIRVLGAIARFLYRHSEHIVVVTNAFKDHLVHEYSVLPEKISVVENGVETDLFTPDCDATAIRGEFGLEQSFVVSYIGTFGNAHGLAVLLDAAERMRENRAVRFLLVGEGAEKENIVASARARGLRNIEVRDQYPRERVPELICASDVCLVTLKDSPVFQTVVPTKMLEFMACAKPVVLCVRGEAASILTEAKGGIVVKPGSVEELVAAVSLLQADEAMRRRMGSSARSFILQTRSRNKTAEIYARVLSATLDGRGLPAPATLLTHT